MDELAANPQYFAETSWVDSPELQWPEDLGSLKERVVELTKALLGPKVQLNLDSPPPGFESTGLEIYDILSTILPPLSAQNRFFWLKFGRPFASMLETAAYSEKVQCSFLILTYARFVGMMGPESEDRSRTIMTLDGSPVELSWVIPSDGKTRDSGPNRKIRFTIDPLHPETGAPLNGAEVIDFFLSLRGGLGICECDDEGQRWRYCIEKFLGLDKNQVPEGSRFSIGFDCLPSGKMTLKAYYFPLPPTKTPGTDSCPSIRSPIYVGDTDFRPLRPLIESLDPSLLVPFDEWLAYLDELDEKLRPKLILLAVDLVKPEVNRIKIYCRTQEGVSWEHAKNSITLSGRLQPSSIQTGLQRLRSLWDLFFPYANSSSGLDVNEVLRSQKSLRETPEYIPEELPLGGLLYYYELAPGKKCVYPKIYFPANHYIKNDLMVSNAIETFYSDPSVNIHGSRRSEEGSGWLSREIATAYDHSLEKTTGLQTYVTFAVKSSGWELTSYFSPLFWH